MRLNNLEKQKLREELRLNIPKLEKSGWSEQHLDILKKHFGFYVALVNGNREPSKPEHIDFIKIAKNWQKETPKNIHELVYTNYIKFQTNLNINEARARKEAVPDLMLPPPGSRSWPMHKDDKYDFKNKVFEFEDWFDDWKYR